MEKSNDTIANASVTENFSMLTIHKFTQTYEYLQTILSNTKLFHKPNRPKRGLINAVGKVSKWFFGTLDSDDEERYDKYLEALSQNQQDIQQDHKTKFSILSNVIQTYTERMKILSTNQKLILNRLNLLEKLDLDITNALYISLILDNIMFQLNTINQIINNIENAISFAHVNTMHNSILNPKQLNEMINTIQNLYGKNRIPKFDELINYYNYLSVQVIIKENLILFSIHTPIILPNQFILHKIHLIPILNQTISITYPFILLTTDQFRKIPTT